jgi:hypothetical protein
MDAEHIDRFVAELLELHDDLPELGELADAARLIEALQARAERAEAENTTLLELAIECWAYDGNPVLPGRIPELLDLLEPVIGAAAAQQETNQ